VPETDPGTGRFKSTVGEGGERRSKLQESMDRPQVRANMGEGNAPEASNVETGRTSTMGMDKTPEAKGGAVEKGDVEAILGADKYRVEEVDGRIFATAGDKKADVTAYFGAEQVLDRFQPEDPDNKYSPLTYTGTVKIIGTQRAQTGPDKNKLQILAERVGGSGRVNIELSEIGQRSHENGRSWRLPAPENIDSKT
jgi:hypothetical protein